MYQQDKYDDCDTDPDAVIDPFPVRYGQSRNTDPVTDLTAQISGQNGECGQQNLVFIVKCKKEYRRDMDDQRVDLLCK